MASTSPDLVDLINALKRVVNWESLVLQLGVKHHKLQTIKQSTSNVDEQRNAALQLWLDIDVEANWQKVVTALQNLDLNAIAKEVKEKHLQPSQTWQAPAQEIAAEEVAKQQQIALAKPLPSPANTQRDRRSIQRRIRRFEQKFRDLVFKAQVSLSKNEANSPEYVSRLCNALTLLPAHLKHEHIKFLKGSLSELCKVSTVREVFGILNLYWSFINPSLLEYIINTFGEEPLQDELESYLEELEEFEKNTKVCDFIPAWTRASRVPPEFVQVIIKMGKSWSECTVYDLVRYNKDLAHEALLSSYTILWTGGSQNSIVVEYMLPASIASDFAIALNEDVVANFDIEAVTIDGVPLDEYCQQYIPQLKAAKEEKAEYHQVNSAGVGVSSKPGH